MVNRYAAPLRVNALIIGYVSVALCSIVVYKWYEPARAIKNGDYMYLESDTDARIASRTFVVIWCLALLKLITSVLLLIGVYTKRTDLMYPFILVAAAMAIAFFVIMAMIIRDEGVNVNLSKLLSGNSFAPRLPLLDMWPDHLFSLLFLLLVVSELYAISVVITFYRVSAAERRGDSKI